MDTTLNIWHLSDMDRDPIPTWQLYGEHQAFPDVLHVERIADRAEGLDWTIAPHRHLHLHQVFVLTSGRILLTIDGERHSPVPPVVINIPRSTVHGFSFSAGTDGFVLTLPAVSYPDLFGESSETAAALDRAFVLPTGGWQTRLNLISDLHAGNTPFRQSLLRAEAMLFVATLLAMAPETRQSRMPDPRIARLEALVRQSFADNRRVEAFAADLSLSARHLSRLCKAQTGLSAQAYIDSLKMHEACRLLVYTRMSAQQVAYALGYDDPSYFSRTFKRSLRLSPGAYRAHFEGKAATVTDHVRRESEIFGDV